MPRWLGVDHGTKRIGVAVGGSDEPIATPLAVIPAEPHEHAIRQIIDLAEQYDAAGIVVGKVGTATVTLQELTNAVETEANSL